MAIFTMNVGPGGIAEMLARARPMLGPQPPPSYVFNYDKRSNTELRKFLKSRKLGVNFTSREQAILELKKADQAATFRFLDLPAELRNHVYRALLTFKHVPHMMGPAQLGTKPKCFPQILSASKQVYGEARGFLYGENDFVVAFWVDTAVHQPGRYQLMCEVCGLRPRQWDGMYMMGMGEPMSLQKGSVDLPDYLRRAEKLTVKIDLPVPPPAPSSAGRTQVAIFTMIALNRALYDLACLLRVKSELKEVVFDMSCELDTIVNHTDFADILSPIRLFPATKTFKLRHLASSIADGINTPVNGTVHTTGEHSTPHAFRSLAREAALYEDLATSTKLDFGVNKARVSEYCRQGREALGLRDSLNTPDTHGKLLKVIDELHLELSSAGMPEYKGEDKKVEKKLTELRAVRKTFGR